jgi:hypothetical protein
MSRSGSVHYGRAGILAIWVIAVGFGQLKLLDYSNTPSLGAAPPTRWPESSTLVQHPGRLTVVMLAHPQCPCTRASIGELAIAAAQAAGRLDIYVVFLESPAFELESDLWRSALEIPNTKVIADPDGIEIQRFGVKASGHTLVYDTAGLLAFSGGVVSARGHAGANRGREAIVELALHDRSSVKSSPVFGCALQTRNLPLAVAR